MDRLAGRAKPTSSPSGKRPGSAPAPGAPPASQPQLPYSHRAPPAQEPHLPQPVPPNTHAPGESALLGAPRPSGAELGWEPVAMPLGPGPASRGYPGGRGWGHIRGRGR